MRLHLEKRWLTCLILLQLLLLGMGFSVQAAGMESLTSTIHAAQIDELSCKALDAVVIIDQSDSMTTNDSAALRIDAVKNLISILYENTALRCPGVMHRIAVVYFGDEASTLFTLDEGRIAVEDVDGEWETERVQLQNRVQPQTLGRTSFYNAFVEAQRIFDSAETIAGEREKAILVVTDGEPCTRAAPDGSCVNGGWLDQYFNGGVTEEEAQERGLDSPNGFISVLNDLLSANTQVNVLMFNRQGTTFEVVNRGWTQITNEHQGRYIPPNLIIDLRQIATILDEMTSALIGVSRNVVGFDRDPQNQTCVGAFYLEPYASSTTIISATRPQNQRIQILDPQGIPLPSQTTTVGAMRIRYNAGQSIERFIVANPKPGRWQVIDPTGQCDAVDATYETIALNVALTTPQSVVPNIFAPYYNETAENHFTITLTDSLGEPFEETPGYPLDICGRIVSPNARAQTILDELPCVTFSAQGNGVWRSDSPAPAPAQSVYQILIEAQVDSLNPADTDGIIHIFDVNGQYQTAPPIPLVIAPLAPTPGQATVLPLNQLENGQQVDAPFGVEMQLVDSNGNPQPLSLIFPGGAVGVAETVLRGVGGTEIPTRPSVLLSPSQNNEYTLQGLVSTPDGLPDLAGSYNVTFQLTDVGVETYNTDNFVLQDAPQTVAFERRELEGVRLRTLDPGSDDQFMLNHIDANAQQAGEPVLVTTQLVNQADESLDADEVFSGDFNQLVQATLLDPAGEAVNTIWLTNSNDDGSLFIGEFPPRSGDIGPEGTYTVTFAFGTNDQQPEYDNASYAFLSPNTETVSFERIERHGVRPVIISVANTPVQGMSAEQIQFLINSIDVEGQKVPYGIPVVVAFSDLNGNLYAPQQISEFLPTNTSQIVQAIVGGPDRSEIREELWLTPNDDGRFTGTLRLATDPIDPEGVYTIDVRVITDLITRTPMARYELVNDRTETVFAEGYQQRGVRLVLTKISTQPVTADASASIMLPLYGAIGDAFRGVVTPVSFELAIYDTSTNETLTWEQIARLLPEDQEPLRIENVVKIAYQQDASNDRVVLTDLEQITEANGTTVIRGSINTLGADTQVYRLHFGLETTNLNHNSVINFTDYGTQASMGSFVRDISNPLYDSRVWNAVKPVVIVLIALYLIWFYLINFGPFSMRGIMKVTVRSPQGIQEDSVRLGGIRFVSRSRKGRNTKAVVTRTRRTPIHPGLPAGIPPQPLSPRAYRVKHTLISLTVNAGQGATVAGMEAKHSGTQ